MGRKRVGRATPQGQGTRRVQLGCGGNGGNAGDVYGFCSVTNAWDRPADNSGRRCHGRPAAGSNRRLYFKYYSALLIFVKPRSVWFPHSTFCPPGPGAPILFPFVLCFMNRAMFLSSTVSLVFSSSCSS